MLRGGDGKAGFAVRNPEGTIVHPYQWRASADYQDQSQNGGYYSVCIDNQFSRFAAKLVNLYITVIRYVKSTPDIKRNFLYYLIRSTAQEPLINIYPSIFILLDL